MSVHEQDTADPGELRDRLVDRALAEAVGGETPPDLSAAILERAGRRAAIETATNLSEDAMDGQRNGNARRWKWTLAATAATLLIAAAALLWPAIEGDRETAAGRRAPTASPVAERKSKDTLGYEKLPEALKSVEVDSWVETKEIVEQRSQASVATAAAPANDSGYYKESAFGGQAAGGKAASGAAPLAENGALYRLGDQGEGEAGRHYGAIPADGASPALAAPTYARASGVETDSVRMLVTPHIIVQDEEVAQLHVELGRLIDDSYWSGPQAGGDKYARIVENSFKSVSPATTDNRLSTFSIDVDTASYANVRQFLLQSRTLPPPDAVRIEELVNYFDYDYSAPTGDVPFASNVEVAACPWKPEHRLVRVGVKGREMDRSKRPKSNLVFLIDVSGSMDEPAKLPLLVEGMKLLTRELGENDRVAIVVYASTEGLVLESTRGTQQATILEALNRLSAGGSTAGGAGIQLAYQVAKDNFIKEGVNRVILCTDGDFNVGVTSPAELERMAEANAKETGVFLTVLGFGRGNLNDAMMEQIADKGNGNYHYVDTRSEAKKVLVEEMVGTLVTIAKDVKIQVEFNPAKVAGYRLIGYENRVMAAEDFNDDTKDAGEIGAGHTVTALYEVVPAGLKVDATGVDELKYGEVASATAGAAEGADDAKTPSEEMLTLKIRYKAPDGDASEKLEFPITDNDQSFAKASEDFKFASAVASFGMLLRSSEFKGNATYAAVAEIAEAASRDRDERGYRQEFVEMVRAAKELSGE